MVQQLNVILMTSPELLDSRKRLKVMATPESRQLFAVLYRSAARSRRSSAHALQLVVPQSGGDVLVVPAGAGVRPRMRPAEGVCRARGACATAILCAELAQVTVGFLVELDKLTQLLESPIFTHLRLQLLEPQRHAYLIKALYGLLMLLPQARRSRRRAAVTRRRHPPT